MSKIVENLAAVRSRIAEAARRAGREPASVQLVAVSKRMCSKSIAEAAAAGQTLFGENFLQEAAAKIPLLSSELTWHFIGHLQSNKAKVAAAHFQVVETVDRLRIASALNEHCRRLGKRLAVFLQVNVGREPQKSGVLPEEVPGVALAVSRCEHLVLAGLMTMPPHHEDPEKIRPYFRQMRLLGESLKKQAIVPAARRLELSMGMSGDFEVAIEEGATLVRIGTAIFGER